ncbi:ABC transporter ATP-binding protein [Candidatus Sodalis pierantonius]|uniref:ABC transporter ATP-binding protein n=1 Tax=Candidatus Sodalis pierantonii TaxID=1486991 RepID=UPI00046CBCB9|nr:ATP-binding cassette domain-containing protein [Candidatus Sodalis pierantonius]
MSTVKIRELQKTYGAAQVLRGIDLDIEDGQFAVLVGPSGCSKSTLLRMIAGLEEISSGHIAINEQVVNDLPPKERDIAMVFQNYALYPHMTVRDNMAFSLKLRNVRAAEINQRVEQVAQSLGLSSLLSRYPRQLSGGQRQRVAMGDLVVVMRDGVIEQAGDPLSLYDFPANQFVAGFLGSPAMNFLSGILQNDGGEIRFGDGAVVPLSRRYPQRDGGPVMFGIRPEHLMPADTGIEAQVTVVEPTGSETIVMLSAKELSDTPFCMVLRERRNLRPGEPVFLMPKPHCEHLFETGSGLRVLPEKIN